MILAPLEVKGPGKDIIMWNSHIVLMRQVQYNCDQIFKN